MSRIKVWLTAFRLRTLPLAFSSIIMGSFVACFYDVFSWPVFILALLTTLFLQVLSNLANDYGDTVNGADHDGRKGPARMVQSGQISLSSMKLAIGVFVACSLLSGIGLVYIALGDVLSITFLLFFLLGIAAIGAAIKYTMGNNPYGYRGLGDLYVLLFFGVVGVGGTFFLHALVWDWMVMLPALSVGALSAGVLNVNNMRDLDSDKAAGKHTLVVKFGLASAKKYHYTLIVLAFVALFIFLIFNDVGYGAYLFVVTMPLFMIHLKSIHRAKKSEDFDPQLKRLALSTLVFVMVFGLGLLIHL
ncbi:1,4-dihydroxy-2-naphthoate polyprenyltransferase [Carboxylicivirga sp. N1Y90]|uniref:1,4-dihydroxy-2-naphthoate polyprenyltransferase n=1 Tax=Carboxylicivirga fragile TaxID=3417571 RepID=UPI003D34A54C|nr:1,4-dihydroxy-2-naphthoate polyprenyltransferase [Marinilabiliaceae bacterium N1Y90]